MSYLLFENLNKIQALFIFVNEKLLLKLELDLVWSGCAVPWFKDDISAGGQKEPRHCG